MEDRRALDSATGILQGTGNKREDQKIGFDVVYVDVGGLSGIDGLLESINLISSIRFGLAPRCIVIKSLCVQRLASRLIPFWQAQKQLLVLS